MTAIIGWARIRTGRGNVGLRASRTTFSRAPRRRGRGPELLGRYGQSAAASSGSRSARMASRHLGGRRALAWRGASCIMCPCPHRDQEPQGNRRAAPAPDREPAAPSAPQPAGVDSPASGDVPGAGRRVAGSAGPGAAGGLGGLGGRQSAGAAGARRRDSPPGGPAGTAGVRPGVRGGSPGPGRGRPHPERFAGGAAALVPPGAKAGRGDRRAGPAAARCRSGRGAPELLALRRHLPPHHRRAGVPLGAHRPANPAPARGQARGAGTGGGGRGEALPLDRQPIPWIGSAPPPPSASSPGWVEPAGPDAGGPARPRSGRGPDL